MPFRREQALKTFGLLLLLAFAGLVWRSGVFTGSPPGAESSDIEKGEELYASHDCTDCHLAAHLLRARRSKGEAGLIRLRKDVNVLTEFLQTDRRHETFKMISESDRRNLIEYLKKQ